ncbi:unnamed protein product, partial [Ranitomeya imitator]
METLKRDLMYKDKTNGVFKSDGTFSYFLKYAAGIIFNPFMTQPILTLKTLPSGEMGVNPFTRPAGTRSFHDAA